MLSVLWLCSWYPNKINPFEGDFVQRHAQATSLYDKVYTIKLTPDASISGVVREVKRSTEFPNLIECQVYYPKRKTFIGKFKAYRRWLILYKREVRDFIKKNGNPDIVHVHIPFKAGLIAQWIKKRYGIPYVITEHWGGYNTIVPENFFKRPVWFQKIIKRTFKEGLGLHSVSNYLGTQINSFIHSMNFVVIPNGVNTRYFFNGRHSVNEKFRLLHLSSGVKLKNIDGIITAFLRLPNELFDLTITGLDLEMQKKLQQQYPTILFETAVPYEKVAVRIRDSDALIIFSDMENSPCVIGEATCCGIPIIATNVGGIPELVNEKNGLLVPPGDTEALTEAIKNMRETYSSFNHFEIGSIAAERFSYDTVGRQTSVWYRNFLK